MSEFMPDESQMDALKTWYPIDHPLHFDPRHPCIKLAGEAGEILDLYGKEEYKPNFSWWKCKHCGESKEWHSQFSYNWCHPFLDKNGKPPFSYTPLILDELGDYSYYLRILAYQKQVTFEDLCKDFIAKKWKDKQLLLLLSWMNDESATLLTSYAEFGSEPTEKRLRYITHHFLAILQILNVSLSQVLDLNYKKLNSNEDAHGWKSATIKTRS